MMKKKDSRKCKKLRSQIREIEKQIARIENMENKKLRIALEGIFSVVRDSILSDELYNAIQDAEKLIESVDSD